MSPRVCTYPHRRRSEAILAVSLSRDDHRALRTIFATLQWRLTSAATLVQGVRHATSRSVPVIVCARDLPDGSWKLLLNKVGTLAQPPRLIVSSRFADESLWAEVLNFGGYDVLAIPFDADEVHRVVTYAVDSWHRQVEAEAKCG